MSLTIDARWHPPVDLHWNEDEGVYHCPRIADLPDLPGAYAFLRLHGETITCIYIGRSKGLRGRLRKHLLESYRLMKSLENAGSGRRVFVGCSVSLDQKSPKLKKVLGALERALISYAISQGQQLLNKQGTRRPNHTIKFKRDKFSMSLVPPQIHVPTS
jgi:hypothetical protein